MTLGRNWFAVQTKAHQESLAARRPARLALEVFLPQVLKEWPVNGDIRRVAKALLRAYFFHPVPKGLVD
jgi:hypothetical protein